MPDPPVAAQAGWGAQFRRHLRPDDPLSKVEYTAPLADGPVVLAVAATPLQYRFSFTVADGTPVAFGSAECAYLSTEVAGGFTGVYIGLYASGTGKRSTVPADFDWFDYEPQS